MLPNPIAFHIFGHPIYWYGIIIAASFLAAITLCMKRAKDYDLTADTIVDLALIIIPSALVGARLYYVIFKWSDFAPNLLRIFVVWEGGLAFYGGVIGAVIAGIICCRVKKINLFRLIDLVAPALALGQAIGRWGNFVNQEAFGAVVTNPSLQFFPIAVWIEADSAWHMATFFYESATCLVICLFLLWLSKRKPAPRTGVIALCYGLFYGLERAIVEGFRLDSLYLGSFRISQVLSVLLVLFCAVALIILWRKNHEPVVEVDPNLVMRRRSASDNEDALDEEPAPLPEEEPNAAQEGPKKEGETP